MEYKIRRDPPRSLTLTIASRVQELEKRGIPVHKLNIGEPDFPTPGNVKDAGVDAINNDFTHYTAGGGIPELRDAVARDLNHRLRLRYELEEIVITVGGKFALAAALMAMVQPEDEVIIPAPYFLSYPDMVTLAGGTPVFLPLSVENGFLPDPEHLLAKITPKTRVVILNSPHNPTGAIYPSDVIRSLVRILQDREIYILSDEVYDCLIFDEAEHVSPAQFEALRDRVILVNSFSKTFCMTGWRLGYMAGPRPIAEAVKNIQSHMTSSPNAISQKAALEALRGPREEIRKMLSVYKQRRDLICELLEEIPNLTLFRPSGTFYVFPEISHYLSGRFPTSMELSLYLLEEQGVAVVPGKVFGDDHHIRLSFATSDEEIREGVKRMKEGLRQIG